MEKSGYGDDRLPVTSWLREHGQAVLAQVAPCAARAARGAQGPGSPRLVEPGDLLHDAALKLLDRGEDLYPDPVSLSACCRILCSFMLRTASNTRRLATRRLRAESARRAEAWSRARVGRPRRHE